MDINFFAETTFRNERRKFGIKTDDRRRHVYVIGKTGMGKTVLLKNMIIQDIQSGKGVGFVDPHGEAAEELLDYIPKERIKDVVYFNPSDINHPISFNVMEEIDPEHRHLVASGLMGVFKKIWPDVWSARMEYILHNSILALLEYPNSTLLGVNRILADPDYREKVVEKIKDPVVKAFWLQEFSRYSQRYETEATAAIQNKIGQFISSPLIRNIIGQTKSSVDMRRVMDDGKILILNLSKGRIGEDSSKLLGGLLITKLQLAAMSRVDTPEEERRDFFLYVDEFQNFATESFTNILSEARKYRLDLILAHQYITQMEETVRDAVFGNVGTLVSFRVGAEDAEFLEKEFSPEFYMTDLVNLAKYQVYLKLLVDGVTGRPFSAQTLAPLAKQSQSFRQEIVTASRKEYSANRELIESDIARWTGDYVLQNQSPKKQVEMFDVQCKKCGQWTKVPFKPDPNRPVFCKPCLKIMEKERAENKQPESTRQPVGRPETKSEPESESKTEQPKTDKLSLEEMLSKKPISFSRAREKKPVDRQQLKTALNESLENEQIVEKSGKIEPGEIVKF